MVTYEPSLVDLVVELTRCLSKIEGLNLTLYMHQPVSDRPLNEALICG